MTEPLARPLHRRFRFSLRTLLIVVVILAIPLGWIAKERRQSHHEQSVAEKLRQQGVTHIVFGGPNDSWELLSQGKPQQGWWREVSRKVLGERIFEIWCNDSSVSDLRFLHGLHNLHSLDSRLTEVSDLAPLAELTNLELLCLDRTQVSDLSPLVGLKNLRVLWVGSTQVSDLSPLAGLTTLRTLELVETKVSDLKPLSGLKHLEQLDLNSTHVSEEQVSRLQQSLPNCKISK